MKVHLPRNEFYPIVKVTAKAGAWSEVSNFDQSFHMIDVTLPEGVDESEVDVRADFCNGRGEIVETGFALKQGTPKKKAEPKPKVETKVEPKVEAKAEPKTATKADVDPAELSAKA